MEHHVNVPEMNKYWQMENGRFTLNSTYQLFSEMRSLGIRAHFWP